MNGSQVTVGTTAQTMQMLKTGTPNSLTGPLTQKPNLSTRRRTLPRPPRSTLPYKTLTYALKEEEYITHITALKSKDPRYPLQGLDLKNTTPISELEKEFKLLRDLGKDQAFWQALTKEERLAIEKYKLAMMQSTAHYLHKMRKDDESRSHQPPPSKRSWFKWFLYGALFLLDLIPMIWGNYVGVMQLLSLASGIAPGLVEGISITSCVIEVVLYYSLMSPLLKEALDIPADEATHPKLEIYDRQLEAMRDINSLMLENNKMSAAEYAGCMSIVTLFSDNLCDLKEYSLYIFKNLNEVIIEECDARSILFINDSFYFIKDKALVKTKEGNELNIPSFLTATDKDKLQSACNNQGKVRINAQNEELIGEIREKTLEKAGLQNQTRVPKFHEGTIKKGLRWLLSGISLALNIASSYAFALFLLGTTVTTVALLGTPAGWFLLAALVIGQIALQVIVRNDALFEMFNPGYNRHNKVRHKIEHHEHQGKKYQNVHTHKTHEEALQKQQVMQQIQKNPLLDPVGNYSRLNFHSLQKPLKEPVVAPLSPSNASTGLKP